MDVFDEGYFKQIFLFVYMLTFYTAMQNIFVAIVMDGYEMSKIRKVLDNDDPFPDARKLNPGALQKLVNEPIDEIKYFSDGPRSKAQDPVEPLSSMSVPHRSVQDEELIPSIESFSIPPRKQSIVHSKKLGKHFPIPLNFGRGEEVVKEVVEFEKTSGNGTDNDKEERKISLTQLFDLTSRIKEELKNLKAIAQTAENAFTSESDKQFVQATYRSNILEFENIIRFMIR